MSKNIAPNFLVIGAEKSATTWLYENIKKHPNVYLSQTKEIHFFNRFDSNLQERDNFRRHDLKWYRQFFRGYNGEQIIGEATPMYLCDPEAPDRIRNVLGSDVKLLVSLRNPVDRAYSHYWMAKWKNHVSVPFDEAVRRGDERFLDRGCYASQLKHYIDLFGREALHIVLFEDVKEQPFQTLASIAEFLEISSEPFQSIVSRERSNASTAYWSPTLYKAIGWITKQFRHIRWLSPLVDIAKRFGIAEAIKKANERPASYPPIDEEQRYVLEEYYADDIQELESILGYSLDAWFKEISFDEATDRAPLKSASDK